MLPPNVTKICYRFPPNILLKVSYYFSSCVLNYISLFNSFRNIAQISNKNKLCSVYDYNVILSNLVHQRDCRCPQLLSNDLSMQDQGPSICMVILICMVKCFMDIRDAFDRVLYEGSFHERHADRGHCVFTMDITGQTGRSGQRLQYLMSFYQFL